MIDGSGMHTLAMHRRNTVDYVEEHTRVANFILHHHLDSNRLLTYTIQHIQGLHDVEVG